MHCHMRLNLSQERSDKRWGHEKPAGFNSWNTDTDAVASASANAQEQENQPKASQPSSGVARISLIHGDVSTQRGDSGDWAAAALNQPIVSSDKVSTGVDSRAEVQLDPANILRLGDSTLASVAGLSRTQIQVQVERGLDRLYGFQGQRS